MKILILEDQDYSPPALDLYRQCGEVHFFKKNQMPLAEALIDCDAVVARLEYFLGKEVLSQASKLKYIVTPTTGLNHIDLDFAQQKKIEILSLKAETQFLETISSTAELSWGLLLALVRRIPSAHASVENMVWDRMQFKGNELQKKTIGIMGFGRIGKAVAQYAQAFNMKVSVYDPGVSQFPQGVRVYQDVKDFLKSVDVLSIHVSYDQSTHQILDKDLLKTLNRGAFLINTARGEVLDEKALFELIETGHFGGVALDVLDSEHSGLADRLKKVKLLSQKYNLIITPHIGGCTWEGMHTTEIFMAEKFLKKAGKKS